MVLKVVFQPMSGIKHGLSNPHTSFVRRYASTFGNRKAKGAYTPSNTDWGLNAHSSEHVCAA